MRRSLKHELVLYEPPSQALMPRRRASERRASRCGGPATRACAPARLPGLALAAGDLRLQRLDRQPADPRRDRAASARRRRARAMRCGGPPARARARASLRSSRFLTSLRDRGALAYASCASCTSVRASRNFDRAARASLASSEAAASRSWASRSCSRCSRRQPITCSQLAVRRRTAVERRAPGGRRVRAALDVDESLARVRARRGCLEASRRPARRRPRRGPPATA